MHYLGGKFRIAKKIVNYLESIRKPNQIYLEPFVGAANVIAYMSGQRIGADIHKDLILLLNELPTIELPDSISEQEYQELRKGESSALRGFCGYALSFSGKFFGGYARSGDRNYCLNGKNSLLKKRPLLEGVEFICSDYRDLKPNDYLIYCDPPYRGMTGYSFKFNHEEFWQVMREWSLNNTVIISEYVAPDDFECVLEIPTKTDLRTKNGKEKRIEKLFKFYA